MNEFELEVGPSRSVCNFLLDIRDMWIEETGHPPPVFRIGYHMFEDLLKEVGANTYQRWMTREGSTIYGVPFVVEVWE